MPFTPGWDLVGVDQLGIGCVWSRTRPDCCRAAYRCLRRVYLFAPRRAGSGAIRFGPAEAVSLVLNYVTAYQMMHRSVHVKPGQRVLIHGAAGGVGFSARTTGVNRES